MLHCFSKSPLRLNINNLWYLQKCRLCACTHVILQKHKAESSFVSLGVPALRRMRKDWLNVRFQYKYQE